MRLHRKDLFASLLIAAVAVPYVGYLLRGEMPPIEDQRGMAGTGLVLGAVAFLVLWRGDAFDRAGKAETASAVLSLGLGVAAYELSDSAMADALLAAFMASMALVWMVQLVDHTGAVHWHRPAEVAR